MSDCGRGPEEKRKDLVANQAFHDYNGLQPLSLASWGRNLYRERRMGRQILMVCLRGLSHRNHRLGQYPIVIYASDARGRSHYPNGYRGRVSVEGKIRQE